ncbi:imidazolonepropionase [Candidatus Bathyarchaeota archaeon]|nr:MAG: imidazolonepropionase [Candidatus Bathyarchaeota archaeon]
MGKEKVDLIVEGANELVTLQGGSAKPLKGEAMQNLGIIRDGAVAVKDGRIVAIGKTSEVRERYTAEIIVDAEGKLVTPGLVDSHTHLVFAGSREDEFEMKLKGASYLEILQKGGGILRTVAETRKASPEELVKLGKERLDTMLVHGTTTVEAKSGYGLSTRDEIKCLEAIKRLDAEHPVDVVPTFLGAHAIPLEYSGKTDEYVKLIVEEMIPIVAERKLAEFCDVFCEKGVFNVEQSRRILLAAKEYGLKSKIHADEMSWLGGAELAAEVGAVSAEHLLYASDEGIRALAKSNVVAVLLPAASFSLMLGRYADARKMINEGVAVALGTDFNPICWVENMQFIIALASRMMKLTPAEALAAATINAAHSLTRASQIGSLEIGKKADIVVFNVPNHRFLAYRFGVNLVDKVVKDGRLVVDSGRIILGEPY